MLSARTFDVVGCATSPLVVANAENAHSQGIVSALPESHSLGGEIARGEEDD